MTEEKGPDAAEEPATVAEPVEAGAPVDIPRRRSRGGLVLAGLLLTAGAGFALAWFDPLKWRGESPVPAIEARLETLSSQLQSAEAARLALADQVAALTAAADGGAALVSRVDALEAALDTLQSATASSDGSIPAASFAALQATVAGLQADLAGIAAAPGTVPDAAIRAAVDQAMAEWSATEAARIKAEVTAAQAQANRAAAVDMILSAAQTGVPYAEALSALEGAEVAAVLRDHADAGLPTLSGLTEAFPEAARLALDASLRETGATGVVDGVLAFLRVQTGARSLEPREGADPDAVLSRAEAAVKGGDVAAALTELAGLPAQGQAAMVDWSGRATIYLAAQEALAGLAATAAQE
jgi:hypothetical protein